MLKWRSLCWQLSFSVFSSKHGIWDRITDVCLMSKFHFVLQYKLQARKIKKSWGWVVQDKRKFVWVWLNPCLLWLTDMVRICQFQFESKSGKRFSEWVSVGCKMKSKAKLKVWLSLNNWDVVKPAMHLYDLFEYGEGTS